MSQGMRPILARTFQGGSADTQQGETQQDEEAQSEGLGSRPSLANGLGSINGRHDPRGEVVALKASIVFDVSDLINYFRNARLPTGIQRVQIEVITGLIRAADPAIDLMTACFTKTSDGWLDLPIMFFNHLSHLALIAGDTEESVWTVALLELDGLLAAADKLKFPANSYLVNLGTSWWLQNYFLHVRNAKAKYGIKYVPFVHDCIPIVTPEHCTEQLTKDFISWAIGAFRHADHFFVNSNATARDVVKVANRLNCEMPPPVVVPLNADFSLAPRGLEQSREIADVFSCRNLKGGKYVLSVGTIESRKNHVLAFSAWLRLIKTHGLDNVPTLVCVGNRGWLNDAAYSKLDASRHLRSKVVMLSKIADPHLAQLYEGCLFTLYPSLYEGWGLPVTESLCFGKVPVLCNSSSLPEAGGEFAEYFDLGAEDSLVGVLERLIFDEEYRAERERKIEEQFSPRSWLDVGQQMVGAIQQWSGTGATQAKFEKDESQWRYTAELGRYYGITENTECALFEGMSSGEIFREGNGWWWPEPWGCWTKDRLAKLSFLADRSIEGGGMLFLGVRGVQHEPAVVSISLGQMNRDVQIGPGEDRWLTFRLNAKDLSSLRIVNGKYLIEIDIVADKAADFAQFTGGSDTRVASVGVCGFMICQTSDLSARLDFMERLCLREIDASRTERDLREAVILAEG